MSEAELVEERRMLRSVVADLLRAMRTWGAWEDGVPAAGPGEFGSVGAAFDRGCEALGWPFTQEGTQRTTEPEHPHTVALRNLVSTWETRGGISLEQWEAARALLGGAR